MKNCPQCGKAANDNEKFCTLCGATFSENGNAPVNSVCSYENAEPHGTFQLPKATTKQEFLKLDENKKIRRELNTSAVICYVCAGITLMLMFVFLGNVYSLIDVALLIGLGLGIHIKQSKVCAIVLCSYAAVNVLYSLIVLRAFGGYLILIAGIYSIIYTFKLDKLWKRYQQETPYHS
ncbi:MAG: hypothetical protein K6F76_02200 [Clostridiales bacterium]|nr:hypothetical protein [Clostridiales bacterium]